MSITINTDVKENKGKPRVWIQGNKLTKSGIDIGDRYDILFENKHMALSFGDDGKYVVSRKKVRNQDRYEPVIDLNSNRMLSSFDVGDLIEICIRDEELIITSQRIETLQETRETRLRRHVKFQKKINVASLFTGVGVLDNALHEGLLSKGIKSCVKIVVEREPAYLDSLIANSPQLFEKDTKFVESGIQFASLDGVHSVDVLTAGIPCTAASPQGMTKKGLSIPEEDPVAGHMFFYVLEAVRKLNPSYVIIENVPQYQDTASWSVVSHVLNDFGYNIESTVWRGNQFGVLEDRARMICVASSKGLPQMKLDEVLPSKKMESSLSEIMEDVPLDDESWINRKGMKEREKKNRKEGRGFKRVLLNGESRRVNTITANYMRNPITCPFITHPENKELDRRLTVIEHSRVKGIPTRLVVGMSDTNAHAALGQGVVWEWFRCVGRDLGKMIIA